MATRNTHVAPKGRFKKRFKVNMVEQESQFMGEENDENVDSPEELLLPNEHAIESDVIVRQWLRSNTDSITDEEGDEPAIGTNVPKDNGIFSRVKISGSCMCKLLVVVYLLGCLLVSTLYIVIYGPNELYLVPEKPPKPLIKPLPINPKTKIHDHLYTEWLADRWTYGEDSFADWPSLPDYISSVQHVASGEINLKKGVWLLDSMALYFMYNVGARSVDDVSFVNISEHLDLNIPEGSRICMRSLDSLYVITSDFISFLNCSPSSHDYCDIVSQWSTQELPPISSAVVSDSDGYLWVGTSQGLYRFNTTPPVVSPHNHRVNDPGDFMDDSILDMINATVASFFQVVEVKGPVISLAWREGLVGPNGWGLRSKAFLFTNHSSDFHQNVSFTSGLDWYAGSNCVTDDFGLLVIGTPSKIYFYDGHMVWFEWVSVWNRGGFIDGPPVALTFVPSGELFIGNNASLSRLNIDYTIDRIGGADGLPYNHITSLRYSPFVPKSPSPLKPYHSKPDNGTLWIGTTKGWSLFNIKKSRFAGYFYGPRWHPGTSIISMGAVNHRMIVLTDDGLSIITPEDWTLARKAAHYQDMVTRHVRYPGIITDCTLTDNSPSSCTLYPSNNDGSHTVWMVAAEAYRYKATKNEAARRSAWRFYQAMKFLVDVTGIKGLPACSVQQVPIEDEAESSGFGTDEHDSINDDVINITSYGPDWRESRVKPGWIWKGQGSSEEITSHIFANTIAYNLIAIDSQEKREIADTMEFIMDYVMETNYMSVDATANTSDGYYEGVWSPTNVNFNHSQAHRHGLSALQILSGLLSAYRITGRTKYLQEWQELINGTGDGNPAHYGLNIINQRITFLQDINYFDDELAFLSYFVYFQTLKDLRSSDPLFRDKEMFMIPSLSLRRTWQAIKKERNAAWNAIYGNITSDDGLTEDIVWSLRHWPLELYKWWTLNSHRIDITYQREEVDHQSVTVLSPRERTQLRWNSNPHQLNFAGSSSETDPGPWLMSYWLAKWTKLL